MKRIANLEINLEMKRLNQHKNAQKSTRRKF